jgi:hypothetical protein
MVLSNEPQESLNSTRLNQLQWLLPRSVQLLIFAALTSCTQPSPYPVGMTSHQISAAQIQAPQGMRVAQPGTPIWYQEAQRTRIAQPQPHAYPKNRATNGAPWCMDCVANEPVRQTFHDARYGWWMYQIQQGDTRSELEKVFWLTPQQMQQLNPSMPSNRNFIHAGAFLRVR